MKFTVLSPAKIILFGEHYVVYGAKAIVAAIKPYNEIEFIYSKEDEGYLHYYSTQKEYNIRLKPEDVTNKTEFLHMLEPIYKLAISENADIEKYQINAHIKRCWQNKGVGNSASISSAIYYGLRHMTNEKDMTASIIYEGTQKAELVSNGPRASGVDATIVSYGGVITYQKGFEKNKNKIENIKDIVIDDDWEFILADTSKKDKKKASTSVQVADFAKYHKIEKMPAKLDEKERKKITKDYDKLCEYALAAMRKVDMRELSELMNQNHEMLKNAKMSSPTIEMARKIAMKNGASGAKLTGAGGVGGVVLILTQKKYTNTIKKELLDVSIFANPFDISQKPVHISEMR